MAGVLLVHCDLVLKQIACALLENVVGVEGLEDMFSGCTCIVSFDVMVIYGTDSSAWPYRIYMVRCCK